MITHQDTDHVGAVERDSDGLFRGAALYIGETENRYLTMEVRRKVFGGLYKLPPVIIDNEKVIVHDGEVLHIDGIKIECIEVPGHTWGHMVYLIDDSYLFTGDTIWLGPTGGRSFLDILAENKALAVRSLAALEKRLRGRGLSPIVITGHTGWSDDLDFVFAHIVTVCCAMKKQKPHHPATSYECIRRERRHAGKVADRATENGRALGRCNLTQQKSERDRQHNELFSKYT